MSADLLTQLRINQDQYEVLLKVCILLIQFLGYRLWYLKEYVAR